MPTTIEQLSRLERHHVEEAQGHFAALSSSTRSNPGSSGVLRLGAIWLLQRSQNLP
jgi:hypothetical protein